MTTRLYKRTIDAHRQPREIQLVQGILVIVTRSGARFARPLLACAYMYLLHGSLLLVPLYSMSKLNNNGTVQRPSRDLTPLTT